MIATDRCILFSSQICLLFITPVIVIKVKKLCTLLIFTIGKSKLSMTQEMTIWKTGKEITRHCNQERDYRPPS